MKLSILATKSVVVCTLLAMTAPAFAGVQVPFKGNLMALSVPDVTATNCPAGTIRFDVELTFEFVKTGANVSKIVVREHGAVVEEASRSK